MQKKLTKKHFQKIFQTLRYNIFDKLQQSKIQQNHKSKKKQKIKNSGLDIKIKKSVTFRETISNNKNKKFIQKAVSTTDNFHQNQNNKNQLKKLLSNPKKQQFDKIKVIHDDIQQINSQLNNFSSFMSNKKTKSQPTLKKISASELIEKQMNKIQLNKANQKNNREYFSVGQNLKIGRSEQKKEINYFSVYGNKRNGKQQKGDIRTNLAYSILKMQMQKKLRL